MVSGISSAPALPAMPMMVARAPPKRRAIGPAANAPSTPPMPPMVKRRPITPGEAWTWRTRKTISTAAAMPLNRLEVAVVAAMARSSALPNTKRRPSAMPCTSPGCPPSGTAGFGSGARMAPTATAETRKLAESTATAAELPMAWTRPPATLGPATAATCALPVSLALPSTRCSRPTRAGRYDW